MTNLIVISSRHSTPPSFDLPDAGEDSRILDMLGDEHIVALQLRDLFEAVKEALTDAVSSTSELTVEVSGSLELKAQGDTKLVIFNVGASGTSTNKMTVTLRTNIEPTIVPNSNN